jgi:hypothetical protein
MSVTYSLTCRRASGLVPDIEVIQQLHLTLRVVTSSRADSCERGGLHATVGYVLLVGISSVAVLRMSVFATESLTIITLSIE